MIRLLFLLLTTRWGLTIVGALLTIGGLVYGIGSHAVTYQSVSRDTVIHFLSPTDTSSSTGYLQLQNDPNLYVINESDFTPPLTGNSFGDGDVIAYVYRPDQTTSIDVMATNNLTHLEGNAYTIEQITVFGPNGQPAAVFATSEFTQNPRGFYQNNWPGGSALLVLGLMVGGLALGLPVLRSRKRQQQGWNVATSAPMDAHPQANPYQQPYQGPTHYPQYAPSPQQPNPYSGQYPPQPGGWQP